MLLYRMCGIFSRGFFALDIFAVSTFASDSFVVQGIDRKAILPWKME